MGQAIETVLHGFGQLSVQLYLHLVARTRCATLLALLDNLTGDAAGRRSGGNLLFTRLLLLLPLVVTLLLQLTRLVIVVVDELSEIILVLRTDTLQ